MPLDTLCPRHARPRAGACVVDTAHGQRNFSFDVGRRVIDQGLLPHCISTDLTVPGRLRTVHSMTEMMTRFLGAGLHPGAGSDDVYREPR